MFSGLLTSMLTGAIMGFFLPVWMLFLFEGVGKYISPLALWYTTLLGIVLSFPAGVLFGLSSYFFRTKFHWVLGGLFGSLATASLLGTGILPWVLYCGLGGILAGALNAIFPGWQGRRIRDDAVFILKNSEP